MDSRYVMQTYARYPLTLVKGRGVKVWDADGREYLDFLGGLAVNVLGHCHPKVVAAIEAQARELIHCSNLYYTPGGSELAALLVEEGGLGKVFFCNSGAEANEGAFKLARKFHYRNRSPERTRILSFSGAFHGRTAGALSATPNPKMREGFGPLAPDFETLPLNRTDLLEAALDERVAALIVEPVQGESGVHPVEPGFLEVLRSASRRCGALLIFDEVQCGMGRLGEYLFAWKSLGIQPDIVTMAKGLGGGLPIGAICAASKVADGGFQPGDHGSTFGANPVATAAALATVRTILEEDLLDHVSAMGTYLIERLNELKASFQESVVEIRGRGLMVGIELAVDAKRVLSSCHERGLLANVAAGTTLRLLPPYVVSKLDVDRAVAIISDSLAGTSI